MSKLNNVRAINEMIRGEHRTQTRKSKGFEKKSTERVLGDKWTDKVGQEWEQKNGYKAKIGKLSKIRNSIDLSTCPQCNKITSEFDKRFVTRESKCYDCIVKEETLMQCEGYTTKQPIYEEFERTKVRNNVTSFLKDAAKDVEMLKKQFTKTEFINSDGTIDKWNLPESVESIHTSLDKQFDKFKGQLLKKLDKGDKDVGIKNTTTE